MDSNRTILSAILFAALFAAHAAAATAELYRTLAQLRREGGRPFVRHGRRRRVRRMRRPDRGRETSYTVADGILARIEAEALVNWLGEQAADATSTVAQPASYATAALETWLATASNAGSILLFGYEEEYAADAGYLALDVSGTNFLWTAQDAATAESVSISLEGSYALGDDASWSADNLVYDADTDTYVAADPDEPACFARLHMEKGW